MEKLHFKQYSNYFFIGVVLLLLILSIYTIKSFIPSILTSMVLAYLFYPVYLWLRGKVQYPWLAISLIILFLIFIVLLPLVFVINSLVAESLSLYTAILESDVVVNQYIADGIERGLQFIVGAATDFVVTVPGRVLNVFVMLFSFYYFLRDGPRIAKAFKEYIPFEKKEQDAISNEFRGIVSAVVFGLLLTGIIEGILGAIGFWIFDLPSPVLWGMVMMIFTILPGIGTSLVWLPAGIIQLFLGNLYSGIGILVYGALVISTVEILLKPKLIETKSRLHPIIILLGVLGGLRFMGFIGIIFGPLVLATLLSLAKVLRHRHS